VAVQVVLKAVGQGRNATIAELARESGVSPSVIDRGKAIATRKSLLTCVPTWDPAEGRKTTAWTPHFDNLQTVVGDAPVRTRKGNPATPAKPAPIPGEATGLAVPLSPPRKRGRKIKWVHLKPWLIAQLRTEQNLNAAELRRKYREAFPGAPCPDPKRMRSLVATIKARDL
jgi:hypothetical protein